MNAQRFVFVVATDEHAKMSSSSPAPASPAAAAPEQPQTGYVERESTGWAPLDINNLKSVLRCSFKPRFRLLLNSQGAI